MSISAKSTIPKLSNKGLKRPAITLIIPIESQLLYNSFSCRGLAVKPAIRKVNLVKLRYSPKKREAYTIA